jgi:hypothetical protein
MPSNDTLQVSSDATPAIAQPPPPPPIDPRPTAFQQRVLVVLFALGVVLLLAGFVLPLPHADLLQRGGFFLCCYAAVVSASWLRHGVISRRIDKFLDRWIKNGASGFYGMMALSIYAQLELEALLRSIAEFDPSGHWLRDALMQSVTGFSMASLKNFISAMVWPATLFGQKGGSGIAPLLLLAGCWAAYEFGRRVLPQQSLRDSFAAGGGDKRAKA